MGITNRDKDLTEQRENFDCQTGNVGISALINLINIPYSCVLEKVVTTSSGLSGSPILGVQIQRFITGAGNTIIAINGSSLLTITAYSTSGLQAHSLPAVSSTLVNLLANDVVQFVTSGTNTAGTYSVNAVIRCLLDFKSIYTLGAGA